MTVSPVEVPLLVRRVLDEIADIRDPRTRAHALMVFRDTARTEYNDRLRACVVELRREGLTHRQIGEVIGLSHMQVHRIIARDGDISLMGRNLEMHGRAAY